MGILSLAIKGAGEKLAAKPEKKADPLVAAMKEFMEAETAEDKADALRGAIELAQLDKGEE